MNKYRFLSCVLVALASVASVVSGSGLANLPSRVQSSSAGAPALSASSELGRILDREGVAARRRALAERWESIDTGHALEVGDWLEVGQRGANALALRLESGAELTLGPGALIELEATDRIRLLRGELGVEARDGAVDVAGPSKSSMHIDGRSVLRADPDGLERLREDPGWLKGYEANASTEALGSLLANIDGRNVPLTIGYHKVTVDIRDQIARTVIEESFENHTSSVLEGVFYFPLPAGASISSFGMWIGGELVQGDIVEKQRAREIYETILREKRDPGLLEWTGGNLFKARIYPIGSEKRIRIAYTQVLARQGDGYAYHYALQSELLRRTPLKRLEIQVNVSSTRPLAGVECPSHATRIRTSEHTARVELSAEEFAPERDFELRVQLQASRERISVVPHRRGDDGYFLLLVDGPPAEEPGPGDTGDTAAPLELLILADTSGSMHGPPRANQTAFIETLIAALGPRDRFNLATCDVDTRWVFERSRPAGLEQREQALAFLDARDALGWSDLDAAFAAACERAGEYTHVVYVGDGVPTSGAADPVELAHALQRYHRGQGTFHGVVPGSSSEMSVLRALSKLGGGSLRTIGGGSDPTQCAFALLKEITTPAVKDLTLDFEGFSVAAVYPEVLPNLASGGQQIVVGRFDPTGGDLQGRVRVRGTLRGREVQFEREVTLSATTGDDGAEGNSFIPRTWARQRLDHLLDQGTSTELRERIIALSEDYQIVTPYTSFLVLESDEDRERFGVQQRFRMRDGEEFFAAGRDEARHALVREQMLLAQGWQRRLREAVLDGLGEMHREWTELLRGHSSPMDGFALAAYGQVGGMGGPADMFASLRMSRSSGQWDRAAGNKADQNEDMADDLDGLDLYGGDGDDEVLGEEKERFEADEMLEAEPAVREKRLAQRRGSGGSAPSSLAFEFRDGRGSRANGWAPSRPYQTPDRFAGLLPAVGPVRSADPEWSFSSEILELLQGLDRRQQLAASERAWSFTVDGAQEDISPARHWIGPEGWLTLQAHVRGQAYSMHWLSEGERGHLREGWRLGRVRTAQTGDETSWSAPFAWHFGDHVRHYASYQAELVERTADRARIAFSLPSTPENVLTLEIDLGRRLVLSETWVVEGERTSWKSYEAAREIGGLWWPTEIHADNKDGKASLTRIVIEAFEPDARERFDAALAVQHERRANAIVLNEKEPLLASAKQAVREGVAGIDERWRLLRHFASTQRWAPAETHLVAFEALARERAEREPPGLLPLRLVYWGHSGRNAELLDELQRFASELAREPRESEYDLANFLLNHSYGMHAGNEKLAFLQTLRPLFTRQVASLQAELAWDRQHLQALANMQRPEELLAARRAAALRWPDDVYMQTSYATQLAGQGEVEAALAHLRASEKQNEAWLPYQRGALRTAEQNILRQGYRLEELVATFEAWERDDPEALASGQMSPYLSALVFLDRERDSWTKVDLWLRSSSEPDPSALDKARLQAAIQHTLGQGYQLNAQRLDEASIRRLVEIVPALAERKDFVHLVGQILYHHGFRASDAGMDLLTQLFEKLEARLDDFAPSLLESWIEWLQPRAYYAERVDELAWRALIERVFELWSATEAGEERTILARIVENQGDAALRLRFYRRSLAEIAALRSGATGGTATAQEEARSILAGKLAYELMAGKWSVDAEREIAALFPALATTSSGADAEPSANLQRRILALNDFVDWILHARTRSLVNALPDVESMSRRTLKAERTKARHVVREGAFKSLGELERTLEPQALRDWAAVERLYLQVKNKSDLAQAWSLALALLEKRAALAAELASEGEELALHEGILAQRCIATCTRLLLSTPKAQLEERVLLLRTQLERFAASRTPLPDGRLAQRDLLIALDRGDELASSLASWYGEGQAFSAMPFGRDYAHVLAERGQLTDAARILEEIEDADELAPEDLRALAGWYTALDRQEDALLARVRSYEMQGADRLGQELYQELRPYQRSGSGVPPELDPEIPLRFIALMRKAPHPYSHLWVLQGYYSATKEYSLLECLPETVIGKSPQNIYPFLGRVAGLASLIDEEATVDRIRDQLEREREAALNSADRRALALLEFQVVLRAARQAHGTERHAEQALRALREGFRDEPEAWAPGEVPMMAAFLADQGHLQPAALADEQLRQLRALTHLVTHPDERYTVAWHLARTLWHHAAHDAAVRTLEAALQARKQAGDGTLPQGANDGLSELSRWLVSRKSFKHAERLWNGELQGSYPRGRIDWLREQLFGVYRDAVVQNGTLSLGREKELYTHVVAAIRHELTLRRNEHHAAQVVNVLCDLWRKVHEQLHRKEARVDAEDFAFVHLPAVLELYQYRRGQELVATVADCLSRISPAETALEFLVVRAETEPSWLRLQNQDFWAHHAWRLGNVLHDTPRGGTPVLARRTLAIVVEELRADLRTRRSRNRSIYDQRHGSFWALGREHFIEAATDFVDEQRDSAHALTYAAEYLFEGLAAHDAAIEALWSAYVRGILHLEGRDKLAVFLQKRSRWQESIDVVAGLVVERPDDVRYRVMGIRAFYHVEDFAARDRAFVKAETHLRSAAVWHEATIAALADGCRLSELFEDCARLYDDAIALHVRTAPKRGVGDGVLSSYYRYQSEAYTGLGRTKAAVDAAAGAIVSWGRDIHGRSADLAALQRVLSKARDLERYVASLDTEVETSGLENPIVRKALGQVYLERREPQQAARQLELALLARPEDEETHRFLLQAYEGMGRPDLAALAQLARCHTAGHDLNLYVDLGRRYEQLEEPERSRRAFTSLVEVSPHESEGHRALAEVLVADARWSEAAERWRHVIRIRTEEPSGYLGLARALIELDRLEEARTLVDDLRARAWPQHFGDVRRETEELLRRIRMRG